MSLPLPTWLPCQDSGQSMFPAAGALDSAALLNSPLCLTFPCLPDALLDKFIPPDQLNKEKGLFFQPLPRTYLVFLERSGDTFSLWNVFLLSVHGAHVPFILSSPPPPCLHENWRALLKPNLHFNDTVDKERKQTGALQSSLWRGQV